MSWILPIDRSDRFGTEEMTWPIDLYSYAIQSQPFDAMEKCPFGPKTGSKGQLVHHIWHLQAMRAGEALRIHMRRRKQSPKAPRVPTKYAAEDSFLLD